MSELLTAKDVELKMFKKVSFGGYSISDVEEFLNQIAEDLETYTLRMNEQQHRMNELEEALKRHEAMKDTIKDALILAQQSARDKEEEAKRQAELILAKAEAKIGEIDDKSRRRLDEAENTADEIVSAARTAAAQIIKSAEEMKEDAQKRLENVEAEASRRVNEAGEKAGDITAEARLEARRIADKAKQEVEGYKHEIDALVVERHRFLRDAEELASTFSKMVDGAVKKLDKGSAEGHEPDSMKQDKPDAEKMALSFSSTNELYLGDEAAIS